MKKEKKRTEGRKNNERIFNALCRSCVNCASLCKLCLSIRVSSLPQEILFIMKRMA
ncbi:hypothetical protein LguiB_018215 [Lonicera macranthoides]